MAGVMIGIDPHKGSHTAVALDAHEKQLGQVAGACVEQTGRWAARAGLAAGRERTWAIEGARGLGQLLAQQLIAAGERVLDVPPKLAARVRLLDTGQINKNDPNDARSVAVAALRAHELPELAAEDHAMVMRVWARRYHDLARLRTQVVCRLHAVLCELVPGGVREVPAGQPGDRCPRPHRRRFPGGAGETRAGPRAGRRPCSASTRSAARPNAASPAPLPPPDHVDHRRLRRRADRGRHRARLRPRHPPLPDPGPVRLLQRHRTDRGLLRRPEDLPALPPRQPPTQPRHPHGRGQPDPPPRQRRPRLLRAQDAPKG